MPQESSSISEEVAWIRSAQSGDIDAFSCLVRLHHQGIESFLAVRLPSFHDAQDLLQDVFVTAFRRLREFDSERPLLPWLRSIALNLLRNHRRKFRAEGIGGNDELQALLEMQIETNMSAGNEPIRLTALRECLEQVDGPVKQLLLAHYGDGVTLRDIARHLGRGYSAVAMQLRRVRELLASCVEHREAQLP
jgi:RNA polymerase sigma-70 factor (ECF subfamily)